MASYPEFIHPVGSSSQDNDPPSRPFAGGAAARPIELLFTNARATANDNLWDVSNDNRGKDSVRLDMDERLSVPRSLMDWFTGQPILDGKSKANALGSVSYFALDLAIAVGAATGAAISASVAPLGLPLTVLFMFVLTGRLRKMQTLLGHEASHGNFFLRSDKRRVDGSAKTLFGMTLNDLVGEIATTFALSMSVEDYRRDHDVHHAQATYTTDKDPDTRYVRRLKSFPWTLFDPVEYARDFADRLHSNLFAKRPLKRAISWAWVGLLAGSAFVMPTPAWIAAVFIPWVVLFRAAAVLQILSLHDWDLPAANSLQDYADRTWGRFSGIPLPPRGLKGLGWMRAWGSWWTEMAFVELPFRVAVLSPDLQAHDVHHLEWILAEDMRVLDRFVDDWKNQPLRRAEVIEETGDPLGMANREVWGVRAMWRIAKRNLERLNRVN